MGNKDVNSDLPEQVSEIETIDATPCSWQLTIFESLLWISQIAPLPTETALREKTYSIGTER